MKIRMLALALIATSAQGASVVADTVAGVTSCGVYLDAQAKQTVPVITTTTPPQCKFDVSTVTAGAHTITMTAISTNDPTWGSQESPKSSPFAFTRPASQAAPSNLRLQ